MTTRSAVLAAGVLDVARPVPVVYTCPPLSVALVKSVAIYNGGADQRIQLLTSRNPGDISPRLIQVEIATDQSHFEQTWFVLEESDELIILYSVPTVYYWISGAVLPAIST